jgi:spore germination protein KA
MSNEIRLLKKGAKFRKLNLDDLILNKPSITAPAHVISGNISKDLQQFKEIFNPSYDVVYREFEIGNMQKIVIIFINGLVNTTLINTDILNPLLTYKKHSTSHEICDFIKNTVIPASEVSTGTKIQEIVDHILSGDAALLIDTLKEALFINIKHWDKRNLKEPIIEASIYGPQEAFTENLQTNISLIRRRLKTPTLKLERIKVGELSQTDIVITYLDGIVKYSLIDEVKERINKINIDAILDSGYIEELIEDNPFSFFSKFGSTERPDRLVANLLEGHIGIIVDTSPIALIAPQTFFQMMQASDDYYERYIIVFFIRCLRYLFTAFALLLPSLYIALLTFHPAMLPRILLSTIIASREGVPFPIYIEILIMEIFFDGLREAGVRLPRPIGQTVSIVGALVIGEAAVKAGIVSPSTVIIVATTGISTFIIPRYNISQSIRILRYLFMILAASFGLYGIFIGFLFILTHLAKLRSFGVPFLSPLAPLNFSSLKDVIIRAPRWFMISRPKFVENTDDTRLSTGSIPHPPKQNK